MIYYEVVYYVGDCKLGGQHLEEWQLKYVKKLVHPYFKMFNTKEINIQIKDVYNPNPIRENLQIQSIEVF